MLTTLNLTSSTDLLLDFYLMYLMILYKLTSRISEETLTRFFKKPYFLAFLSFHIFWSTVEFAEILHNLQCTNRFDIYSVEYYIPVSFFGHSQDIVLVAYFLALGILGVAVDFAVHKATSFNTERMVSILFMTVAAQLLASNWILIVITQAANRFVKYPEWPIFTDWSTQRFYDFLETDYLLNRYKWWDFYNHAIFVYKANFNLQAPKWYVYQYGTPYKEVCLNRPALERAIDTIYQPYYLAADFVRTLNLKFRSWLDLNFVYENAATEVYGYSVFTDGLTFWLLWLTFVVVFVACFAILSEDRENFISQFVWITLTQVLVIFCFTTKDLLHFFLAFEALLIPLYFLIGKHGSRSDRIRAANYLVIFTLAGSVFLWYVVLYSVFVLGHTRVDALAVTFSTLSTGTQATLWWCLFLGFAFKIPLVPFHLWLTVAHVEAPTAGSIILAGLILKLGGYAMIRFILMPFSMLLSSAFGSIVLGISCVGYTYATLSAIRQLDLKRFVAYTSVAHMNFGLAALFTMKEVGFLAFVHTMVSHGVIASALFLLVGHIYKTLGTRDSLELKALSGVMPFAAAAWTIFSIANAGWPLFSAFPGEFYGLIAIAMTNRFVVFAFGIGFYFTGVYAVLQIARISYGSAPAADIPTYSDINALSLYALLYLGLWTVLLGVFPDAVFTTVDAVLYPELRSWETKEPEFSRPVIKQIISVLKSFSF